MTTTMRFVSILFAAAFALVQAGTAQAELKKEWVEYAHGDAKLKGYLVYDDAITGKRPAVLMMHAREGMSAKSMSLAETWAKLGYVSFAPTFSATAKASCRRMCRKCRRRPRSTTRTVR